MFYNSELHFLKTFLKVPTLVNGVALGKAMNTEKGGPFYIQNELIWICNETKKDTDRFLSFNFLLLTVRPFRTEVLGAETAMSEGSVVSLMCRTWGARPAAVITWFNGSRPFSEQPAGQVSLQVRKKIPLIRVTKY